jgi:hypothetical protein
MTDIAQRVTDVLAFEIAHPEFCGDGSVRLTPEQWETNARTAVALMLDWALGQVIKSTKEERIARCDPASGRVAMGQDPFNWVQ